ncbi:phosphoglycerate kinase [Streptomyces sp. BE147]|uniref:phosphoglycerate kinase n=1 Tax=Streptomyces sp. BE147 TaxID=3002524 RepID=UPI002E77B8A2|nr:phosphoglycerate kinase [Streptomyces sp. BE147]MEE1736998.1 phosphoglycerate kinase [Streptomyces sp. BE147]
MNTLPLLTDRPVATGERWIFSVGFNVADTLGDTSRIDSELPDIAHLAEGGARVAVLSHQGRHSDSTARHLDDIARYIADRLHRPVHYHPDNTTDAAADRSRGLAPGEVCVFGNTRHHPGEETGDPHLAARFAALGDYVAVGGFSKAHRRHASNVGILAHRPGWAAGSLLTQTRLLTPWAGSLPGVPSAAFLGGTKPEKTLVGLTAFTRTYDLVVPGGAVLHHLLRARGYSIGASELGTAAEDCTAAAARAACSTTARIHLPRHVVIARRDGHHYTGRQVTAVTDGVPDGYAITDFLPEPWLTSELRRLRSGARVIVAGTPSLHTAGYSTATDLALGLAGAPAVDGILLGGDTVAELRFHGPTSTGGGSALHYLHHADLPVLQALRDHTARRTA